jgi:hypothetical protein
MYFPRLLRRADMTAAGPAPARLRMVLTWLRPLDPTARMRCFEVSEALVARYLKRYHYRRLVCHQGGYYFLATGVN